MRTFIEVPTFTRKWFSLGLTDEHLRELQNVLIENPKLGDTIPGTNGIRKLRIPLEDSGKRGGARVIYVDISVDETIYFLDVYTKNKKTDLTEKEKKSLRNYISIIKEEE